MARKTIKIEPAISKEIIDFSAESGATPTQPMNLLKLRSAGSGGTKNNIDIGDRSQVWAVFEEEVFMKYSK
jgi:hypothetical protein